MPVLHLTFASGETSLSVRRFHVEERVSSLFTASVWAVSEDPSIDLDTIVGQPASFHVVTGADFAPLGGKRRWTGICAHMALVHAEATGLSTYLVRIVPTLWLLTQRRDHRIFQHLAVPDLVDQILDGWGIARVWRVERGAYPKLEYRCQYGESDYAFLCRMLEEAGIAFTFPEGGEHGSRLTLDDRLHAGAPREAPPLLVMDDAGLVPDREVMTEVRLGHHVRPGAHVIRDFDLRNPSFALLGEAKKAPAPEDRLEQFEYRPGRFRAASGALADTPAADDKGTYRHDKPRGDALAERSLEADRVRKKTVAFETNTIDLWPGSVFSFENHPHAELGAGKHVLVTGFALEGTHTEAWRMSGDAVLASAPYRPERVTAKPQVKGVQSALVVGPYGQEVHADETGRVRVQFPWDRLTPGDDWSSSWVRVSQQWAGSGFGMMALPRIGQEVLVAFLDGDPDQPVVVGRLFDLKNPAAYKLPDNETRSTFKSDSSPGSEGWNEILLEDKAGDEEVFQQAQKNLRRLVKNDETITVVQDRTKVVVIEETDTTIGDRVEATDRKRVEEIDVDRTTAVRGKLSRLVKGDEHERTMAGQITRVGKDLHVLVKGTKRERVHRDLSLEVHGSSNKAFGGYSLSTWMLEEKIGRKNLLEANLAIHEKAGVKLVAEGVSSVYMQGPGGRIKIGAGGVDIFGQVVKINAGGAPGTAPDAKPAGPEPPKEAQLQLPKEPSPPKLVDPTVTIGRVIRGNPYVESNASLANGMPDSVPPNKTYTLEITVTPQLEPGRFLEINIEGNSDANGTASVTPRRIETTTTITVTGATQTAPNNAGKLKIRATLDGVVKAESEGFSVCAHPLDMHNTLDKDIHGGGKVGAYVTVRVDSDSGLTSDLDKALFSEVVRILRKDIPPFSPVLTTDTSGYIYCIAPPDDDHTTIEPDAGTEGWYILAQLFVFECLRCGVMHKVQPNTGMSIEHHVFESGSQWVHNMRKFGKKTTIDKWTSEAGDANVTTKNHVLS